jgi:hypothetical protein
MMVLGTLRCAERICPMPSDPFSNYRDNFDPETLAILEAAFNEAWEVLTNSGGTFDQEATRNALADLIMSFASEGETNPKRLKVGSAANPNTIEKGRRPKPTL